MAFCAQGWNQFKFILTPSEIEQLFDGLHYVNFCGRVPADYVETSPEAFFAKYRAFYEKLRSGHKLQWQQDHPYLSFVDGLSNDLQKCAYGEPFQDHNDGQFYKLSDFSEPCVGIQPFALVLSENQTLHSNYSYLQFLELTVGIGFTYPKKICYFSEIHPQGYAKVLSCTETGTFKIYEALVQKIKLTTKCLRFQIDGKAYRSGIRISQPAQANLSNFYFAKYYRITL